MHKKSLIFIVLLFSCMISIGQVAKISGSIRDTTTNSAVKNAVVALLSPKDSILKEFTRTKEDGSYSFNKIPEGKYILMVMHPYFADFVDDIDIKNSEQQIPLIAATSKSKLLAAVIIKSGSPIRIKGDTTIYTADSFNVSANANVEELLKKLPGIQVDKNGQIKAMGETVEKVLVDGEEFFGDDPGMAVKNLRADAVKEVQVFDKKSEQAEFTGIDDGKTKKTINLKLKEDKKTGYFGKIELAGGTQKDIDDRYNNNLMYSTFKGKRKLSAFLLNGNTGQDGLSWQDEQKYGGDNDNMSFSMDEDAGAMYSWRGGGTDDEPEVNTENGFIKNINAGLQYSNKWNDKQTLNFSPKYNEQDYTNGTQTYTQQQIGDSVLNTNANAISNIKRNNIKLRGIYDIKIDSVNSLKITANANFYHTESELISTSFTTSKSGMDINSRDELSRKDNDKNAFSGNIIFKHKFKKQRRTFSLTADWNLLSTVGSNNLKTLNESFDPLNPFVSEVDQLIESDKVSQRILTKLVYTEPLSKNYSLELAHEVSYNFGTNDQTTYSFTPATGKYDAVVDSLTNDFKQSILINKPSVKISYSYKKIKYNFGSGFGVTHYDLLDKTFNKDYIRDFTNIFPSAGFTYNYKPNHSLRFNYSGSTTQPTINQLQPLRNNTDKFNQYIGNPDLNPSFGNSFNFSHNSYNFIKDMWMYQSANLTVTSNSITNNIIINPATGEKITQPINTNGNVSLYFYSGVGFKVKKIDTRFNISPFVNYNRFADVLNSKTSYSKALAAGLSVYASKSKDKKYDFSLSNSLTYNSSVTSQNSNRNQYYSNTVSLEATIYIHKVWSIGSDVNYYFRQKTAQSGSSINNTLWNAKVQRTFKNNEFTTYIKVRDILNENIGIDRNFYGNTYTETTNYRLKRYFLVGFAWDFKNKAKKAK